MSYTIFFGAGLISLYAQNGASVFTDGAADSALVRSTVTGTAMVTLALAFGADIIDRPRFVPLVSSESRSAVAADRLIVFTCTVMSFAVVGVVLVVAQLGGPVAASNTFVSHDRNVGLGLTGSLGLTLWSLFNLPAVVCAAACVTTASRKADRVIALVGASIVLVSAVYIFASRLTIILALLSIAGVLYHQRGRTVPLAAIATVGMLFIGFSLFLLAQRGTEIASSGASLVSRILDSLSYGILDVSIAVVTHPLGVYSQFNSLERYATVLSSISPVGGPAPATLSSSRIDVIVVRAIGNDAQAASSGLPPSLPTALLAGSGLVLGCLLALGIGMLLSAAMNFTLRRSSFLATVVMGLLVAFIFNVYKGGDLPLDLASEARRLAYLSVLWIAIVALFPKRGVLNET